MINSDFNNIIGVTLWTYILLRAFPTSAQVKDTPAVVTSQLYKFSTCQWGRVHTAYFAGIGKILKKLLDIHFALCYNVTVNHNCI